MGMSPEEPRSTFVSSTPTMTSDTNSMLSFSISHEQQNFRLLELPQSLLDLLTSENPPILQLKSAIPDNTASSRPTPKVVLCTDDQTFEVRQIQSSNILYILQLLPAVEGSLNLNPSLAARAQCKELLELAPVLTDPRRHLRETIPIYNGHDMAPNVTTSVTRAKLLEDAPFSDREFEIALTELCVFSWRGLLWIPSASLLRETWASLLSAFDITTTNPERPFRLKDLKSQLQENECIEQILSALLSRITSERADMLDDWLTIDRGKTVSSVGDILLQQYGPQGTTKKLFLENWQNELPEAWREGVAFDLLKGQYSESGDRVAAPSEAFITNITKVALTTQSSVKNKWHERFKGSKK